MIEVSETRVMVVLLDGAPFGVFSSLARKGVLPNMRKLMKIGCFNVLNSTVPPISPVAIPSLLTGRNPGKHGLFGFGYMENGFFRPYTSKSIAGETLWDMLSAANRKVILLNVPWTFPPFKVNGIMVSGPPCPRNRAESYPPEIVSILQSNIGRYYVDLDIQKLDYNGADEGRFLEEAHLITKKRAQAMHYLMENFEWDLFLTVFTTLDRVQHVLFGHFDEESPLFDTEKRKVLMTYYKEIDGILGETLSLIDKNTILFIVSDHGFEYLSKHVGINNMLVQGGFARERSKFQMLSTERIVRFLERIGYRNPKRLARTRPRTTNIAKKIFPTRIDYSKSECWGIPGASAISINKNNVTDGKKVEAIKERLTHFLYSIKDKDNGEKIVEKVYDKSEIYDGNCVGNAPDLIIVFKKGYEPKIWRKEAIEPVKPFKDKNRTLKTGTHISFSSQRGIFVVSGPSIKEGLQMEANIVDIAPTILHILGAPVSLDVDGQVLKQIFRKKSRFETQKVKLQKFHAEKKESQLSKENEEAIKERLRILGYI